jgi:high-affinity iron transporter
VLLIMCAAGLVAHGIHELQEAGIIPFLLYPVYDINGFLSDKGDIGSILKGLFGYNGNPGLIEIISYWVYMAFISIVWIKKSKNQITEKNGNTQKEIVRMKKSTV